MKLLSFTGSTPAEALRKAQVECGEDALVVSTKQVRKKTLSSDSLYEVVIAINADSQEPKKEQSHTYEPEIPKKPSIKKKDAKEGEDVLLNISEAAKQISEIAKVTRSQIPDTFESEEKSVSAEEKKSPEELNSIKQEIAKLSDKVKLIQEMFWDEKSPQRGNLIIPPEFSEIYKKAGESGMSKDHLDSIMTLTLEHMPQKMRNNSKTVKRYFQVLLRKMIPIRMEPNVPKGSKKITMFVGPTGVGKTTTLAKLAARYSYLKDKRSKVGIITLDTYRIGAVEQLFQYAKMMKLPIEDVVDANDFQKALNSLSSCDTILIDTVGSSQFDKDKLLRIERFLEKSEQNIDVNLVLSAGVKLDDLKDIYDNFSFLNIDTLIFTKLDETKRFGNIFSLIRDIDRPVSYVSTGQEVPDDIMVASSDFLVDCILDGFKKGKKNESGR